MNNYIIHILHNSIIYYILGDMMKAKASINIDGKISDILSKVSNELKNVGIHMDHMGDSGEGSKVKVVVAVPDLKDSVSKMAERPRGETVMVRINREISEDLDAWVETGYFKSRSEAAALFLEEGLTLRSSELDKLKDALEELQKARETLRQKAKNLFGR